MTEHHGYYGVALAAPKCEANFGGIMRSAHAFGASFICLIGARYHKQPTDTSKAARHIPLFTYPDMETFLTARPYDCELVRVEVNGETPLPEFRHNARAIYLFGPEDGMVGLKFGDRSIYIDTAYCLNLASTASIVMYDRAAKAGAA